MALPHHNMPGLPSQEDHEALMRDPALSVYPFLKNLNQFKMTGDSVMYPVLKYPGGVQTAQGWPSLDQN